MILVRRLEPEDAESYIKHRYEALTNSPLAFSASPEDDLASTPETVREMLGRSPESVVFGAFGDDLVGSIGVYRDPHRKFSHKTHIWGMYVTPSYRGRGLGRELLEAAMSHARSIEGVLQVHLTVSDSSDAARGLYEAGGFEVWGTEPNALHYRGEWVSDHHMVLML